MSKVHLYLDEDTTFYCSKCYGLGVERVVIRNPIIGKEETIWKCKDCGCTKINNVDSFDKYISICQNNNIKYLKNRDFFNFKNF